jgi:hypothetical protein
MRHAKAYRLDFADIEARADFRAVLAHHVLMLVGQAEWIEIRCPFHDEERPSCRC